MEIARGQVTLQVSDRTSQARAAGEFPLFDWLRFVLASVVALYHGGDIGWSHAGNFAVQVFFALSGWLIGGILLRSDRRHLPRFYYNRATRIWIPYGLAVAVLYIVAAFHEGARSAWWRCLFFDITFTHNWFINPLRAMPLGGTGNHFWSISVEEQFYLAAPLLIVLLPFGRSIILWAVLASAAVVSNFWYGAIALGVLAAVVRCQFGDWQFSRIGFAAVIACLVCSAASMFLMPSSYAWASPPLAASIVLALSWAGPRNWLGEFLGGVSYPLYLYHWVGLFAARYLHLQKPFAYLFALLCGIGAYLLVDRNVVRLRGRFYHPSGGRLLMITAYALLAVGIVGGL